MATLIDWSEVDAEVSSTFGSNSCESRSQALGHVLLRSLFDLTSEEIADTITDGPSDRGIDAVYIQDAETPPIVHIFQFKYVESFDKAENHFPSTEIDKLLSFVQDLLSKNKNLEKTCNPLLWDKVPEIWDLFDQGAPRFEIHFAANQEAMISTQKERVADSLAKYRYFNIHHHDLASLAAMLIQRSQPHIDAEIQLVDNQYFERSDGNIRGLIATVQAKDLVALIQDKANADIVNLDIFDQNVRVYLTRKNKINQRIFETAISASNAEFWYLNNGVTMTCESLEYPPGVRAPVAKLRGVQIVNGGQTSNALFEAHREDPDALKRVLILLRIYELKNKDVAARIAESTNSQTPIRSRDLRANDEIQRKIEVSLTSKGYYYERKADQYKDRPRKARLDALAAAQSYVAYFKSWPEVATKDRGKIFGELYDAIFNDELTADQLLASYQVFNEIFIEKRNLELAIRRDELFNPKRLFLIDGAYYVLYAISRLADQKGIEKLDPAIGKSLLPNALKLVEKVVENEKKTDKAFAHKRFFKSSRARQLIDEASRRKRTRSS